MAALLPESQFVGQNNGAMLSESNVSVPNNQPTINTAAPQYTIPSRSQSASTDPGKRTQPEHDVHRINPFVHKLVWDDPIDKFKTVVLTVVLLPFRVVLILVCLVIAWALANIGLFGLSKEDLRTTPLAGWRRQLRGVTARVMRLLFLFGSFNYIRYKGQRASPKEAPVICVAPHTAFFDSICVVVFGPSAVVAKYETASLPFFGTRANCGCVALYSALRRMKGLLSIFAVLTYTCAGLGITIRGRQARRTEAPVLVVSPHSSFLDAVIIYLTGLSSPLVRNADRNLGKLIDYAQPIYVCREDPHSRQSTIREIIHRAYSKKDWPQILIFPEGTCTNRTSLIQFKPGAFYPGVPIQPVLIRYPNEVDTVTWTWEGPSAIQLLWRTLTKFHTFCEIEFLPVYYPNDAEKSDPKLFARNVRDLMAKALEIPISDYTFDDCKLMTYVKNIHLPYASDIADIEKLRRLAGAAPDIESLVTRDTEEFNDANRFVTLPQFTNMFCLIEQHEATAALFQLFVKPGRPGVIDLREYLLMTLFLNTLNKPRLEFVEHLFNLYGKYGSITRAKLYDTLKYVVKITREEADVLFVKADRNQIGNIGLEHFTAAIKGTPLQAKLAQNNDPNNLRLR